MWQECVYPCTYTQMAQYRNIKLKLNKPSDIKKKKSSDAYSLIILRSAKREKKGFYLPAA